MTQRHVWDSAYEIGHGLLDQQHRALLEQCNALADCVDEQAFRAVFTAMLTQAREHFAAELDLLGAEDPAWAQALAQELSEFEYLADDILTTENFAMDEIQRFLALWWVGHIVGVARNQS